MSENFTKTQIREIARFRALLNGRENYALYHVEHDLWVVYDVETDNEWSSHEDDPEQTILDCEYVDLWIS